MDCCLKHLACSAVSLVKQNEHKNHIVGSYDHPAGPLAPAICRLLRVPGYMPRAWTVHANDVEAKRPLALSSNNLLRAAKAG